MNNLAGGNNNFGAGVNERVPSKRFFRETVGQKLAEVVPMCTGECSTY